MASDTLLASAPALLTRSHRTPAHCCCLREEEEGKKGLTMTPDGDGAGATCTTPALNLGQPASYPQAPVTHGTGPDRG